MSDTVSLDQRIAALGRASRRAALISLLGFVVVFGALVYATVQLAKIQNQRAALERERVQLAGVLETSKAEVQRYKEQVQNARQAVAASRRAINAFHAGRLEDAVALYEEALEADPGNAYLQNLRAYALFRLHRTDAAIEAQRRGLADDPSYPWGYFDLARFLCASATPRLEEARGAARKAIALNPALREVMRRDGEFQRVCRGKVP